MSGIQNLLKYRFQRRTEAKVETPNNAPVTASPKADPSTVPSTGASGGSPQKDRHWLNVLSQQSSGGTTNSSASTSSQATVGYNSNTESSQDIRPRKGVGLTSKRGGALVINSDSEDSPVKSPTSSPWFTKKPATSQMNGHATPSSSQTSSRSTVSYRPSQSQATASTSSQSQATEARSSSPVPQTSQKADEEERELKINIDNLHAMFPALAVSQCVEALAMSENDLDKAIDYIIAQQNDNSKKRTFTRIQTIGDSDDDSPSTKKFRSSGSPPPTNFVPTADQEKLNFLSEAFPLISTSVIRLTLKSKNNDLERAMTALSESGLNKPTTLNKLQSATNCSSDQLQASIKSITAARHQAKLVVPDPEMPRLTPEGRRPGGPIYKDAAKKAGMKEIPRPPPMEKISVKEIVEEGVESSDEEQHFSGAESEDEEVEEPSDPILQYLNEARPEELACISGLSKKKAETVLKIRPFDDWEDLVAKIENSKDLTFQIITGCKEVLRMRDTVEKLMHKCLRISQRMEGIVSEVKSDTTIEHCKSLGKDYIPQQPKNLNSEMNLTQYQLVGLNWLHLMHLQGLNGILGDEMGLGKTIQTISFLAHLLEQGDTGPHVVVAPSSTLDNWLRELSLWCPDIKVILYYGTQEDRRELREQVDKNQDFNLILTSYNMASGSYDDRQMFKKTTFHYAVFDEGHMLKNMSSIRYQTLMKIKAQRRLLLTGTPLQNNLVELMSLLAFVMPDMFRGQTEHIKKVFTTITSRNAYESKGSYERRAIEQAKSILKPFFLRRLKREVLQQLPMKIEYVEKVQMAPEQQDLYDSLRNQFTQKIQQSQDKDSTLKTDKGSMMLMQLRKAANHPLLHRQHFNDRLLKQMAQDILQEPTHCEADPDLVFEDMEVMSDFELHNLCKKYQSLNSYQLTSEDIISSGKFRQLDIYLEQLLEKESRVLLFSQFTMMLDIIEAYLNIRQYKFTRLDGQTPVAERQELIDEFNEDESVFIFLLSTRAGGLGINLTAANTVIVHDIDFNPYNDKQAEDRCHRVGQTRTVTVYRLVSKGTVEEAMFTCAQNKLRLEQDVTGQSSNKEEENTNDVASLLKQALNIEPAAGEEPNMSEHLQAINKKAVSRQDSS